MTDNGPGITDFNDITCFTTKKTGTGLGLPIVTKITNEHSGKFTISKMNKGKGTLCISLPKFNVRNLSYRLIQILDYSLAIFSKNKILWLEQLQLDQAVFEINKKIPDLAVVDIKLDRPDKDGIDPKINNAKRKVYSSYNDFWTCNCKDCFRCYQVGSL